MEKIEKTKAVTLYFSGTCNLDCSYCFQPKIKGHMGGVNKEIVEWISSGNMEKDILEIFGDGIEILSLWGGEPTVNLIPFANRLKQIKQTLPKFNSIYFSTNISTPILARNIIYLLEKSNELFKDDKNFRMGVQFSLDGPSDFNDCARIGSYSGEIVENIKIVLEAAERLEIKNRLAFTGKATHSRDNIQRFSNYEELLNYFKFFDNAYEEWSKVSDIYPRNSHNISLVYPGNYRKEDGEAYLKLLHHMEKIRKLEWKKINNFDGQLESRIYNCDNGINRKNFRPYSFEFLSSFNCSAGEGSLGLDHNRKIHICQSSFLLDEEAVKEIKEKNLITEFESMQGYSFRNYDRYIKEKVVIERDDDEIGALRLLSNLECFRKNIVFRLQYIENIIPVLVATGDILEKYKDPKEAEILAFVLTMGGFSCPSNNIWEFGSVWVVNPSPLMLLGNGVLDFLLEKMRSKFE